jgi:hypothetical protein
VVADQDEVVREVLAVLERCQIDCMLVGSWASGVYGEPRFMQDIDLVVDLPREKAALLYAAFGPPKYDASREAIEDAIRRRGPFNIIHLDSSVKVSFYVAKGDALSQRQMQRRRRVEVLPGLEGWVASPEDIILGKLLCYEEGGSEKHLRDIAGMLPVQNDLDRAYIERWAGALALSGIWQAIVTRLSLPPTPQTPPSPTSRECAAGT